LARLDEMTQARPAANGADTAAPVFEDAPLAQIEDELAAIRADVQADAATNRQQFAAITGQLWQLRRAIGWLDRFAAAAAVGLIMLLAKTFGVIP